MSVEEKEQIRARVRTAGGAVCAHIGIGADDEQAKIARDRLAAAMDRYRQVLTQEK